MVATAAIGNLIREKKTYRIVSEIQTGMKYGMKTMDQSLLEAYFRGIITRREASESSYDGEQLEKRMVSVDQETAAPPRA